MLVKLRKLTRDNSCVRWFLQNGALFFSTRQASMAQKSPGSHKVQALYDLCRKTFTPSGTPPLSSHSVQKLCSLLDTIAPADVGLPEDALEDDRGHGIFGLNRLDRVPRWAQPITYVDIHECESFTMCIFCFPTSAVIPLHDHPGMTVFSKVLYGSLHVKAYDWVEPTRIVNKSRPVRLAKLAVDNVLTAPCTPTVLHPKTGGNVHCFTAITPCAVLDILSPPYSEDAGRRCTYYCDYAYSTFSNEDEKSDEEENYAWLAETGTPDDLYMRPGKYNGPAIQVDNLTGQPTFGSSKLDLPRQIHPTLRFVDWVQKFEVAFDLERLYLHDSTDPLKEGVNIL